MTHQTAPPPTTVGPSWQLSTGTDCGSKATVTVPPTATTTASSFQLPPDLQAGSISSAPFCPFTPAFPMRRFFLLPQLLAAPLLAGSLFILPLSIAEAQEGNNTVRNNEVHPLAEIAVGLLSGAGSVLTTVYFMSKSRLKKLEKIYEKTIKMDNDLKNLEKLNGGVTEKVDSNNKLLIGIKDSNRDLNDSIQGSIQGSIQNLNQNLNSKLDAHKQTILERINEIPYKIQSS